MRRFTLVAGLVLVVSGLTAGVGAQLPPGGTFTDDNGNIHEGYIEAIAAEGITAGCGPGLYCPGHDVTRGQMASFLARALDLPPSTRDWFPDDTGLVHEENINRIADAGITTGFRDGTYRPFDPVRRDQMASFLSRALKLPAATQDHFSDDTGLVHEENINRIADAGVTKGCGAGLYCPGQNVRRDQMASFLGRALGLTPIIPPPPTGTLFSGPVEPMPGFTGTIVFELSADGTEIRNPTLRYDLTDYQCGGATVSVIGGELQVTTVIPVVNDSFSLSNPLLTLSGGFDSETTASGTISGTQLSTTNCDWGPLSWTATSGGQPPPPSSTTSTTTPSSPHFSGPVEAMPGFSGSVSFERNSANSEVRDFTLDFDLDNFKCNGSTISISGGKLSVPTGIPIVGNSFSYSNPVVTVSGSFDTPTTASGSISGTQFAATHCPWGPLEWTATNAGIPPTTSTTTTTTTTIPGGTWPPCDFAAFTVSGSGSDLRSFQIPGDKPAILNIAYSGDDLLFIATLDASQETLDLSLVSDLGGGYEGTRPVNHHTNEGVVRYLDIEVDAGAWEIEARPVCDARSMTGTSISGLGDDVVIVNRSGTASLSHNGDSNFIIWSHQSFTTRDLEVNVIGDFSGQADIDAGTIFLDVFNGLEPGQWSVTFP